MSGQDVHLSSPIVRGESAQPALALNGSASLQKVTPMELHVFLRNAALPAREEWQTAITEEGFALILDATLDVRNHAGFSQIMCWGKKSGFEFDLNPAPDITSRYRGVSERIGARNVSANFRWQGNVLESLGVHIASAVLAKLADGILYYPQKAHFSTSHEAMAMARQLIAVSELS